MTRPDAPLEVRAKAWTLKRTAWAYGTAPKGSDEEARLLAILFDKAREADPNTPVRCPACYGTGDTTNEGELWCDLPDRWGIHGDEAKLEAAYSWSRTGTQDTCPVCRGMAAIPRGDAASWALERSTSR